VEVESMTKRIGIITGGGDCPGLNAVIRAVVKTAMFKYGIPIDCDLVFDVRFLPNPYYIPSMRKLTGKNEKVSNYVLNNEETITFFEKLVDLLDFLLPNYIKEGKSQLVIGIGCTGGRHRSVAIAELLHNTLVDKQYSAIIGHRDIERDNKTSNK
jgi:UPF0042 nucleotide-binding protein